jgi:hypothetical protein
MTTRLKLLSAATAIGMALAASGTQAAEVLLTAQQLDTVTAGATAAATGANSASLAAATNSPTVSALLFNVNYPNGTGFVNVNNDGPGAFALAVDGGF